MSILTHKQLADYIETALDQFSVDRSEAAMAMGYRSISQLLNVMGMKNSGEGIKHALDRMRTNQQQSLSIDTPPLDVMNIEHRKILGRAIKEMFAPLGLNRIIMIGLSEHEDGTFDDNVFVIQFTKEGLREIGDLRPLFKHLANGNEGETLQL